MIPFLYETVNTSAVNQVQIINPLHPPRICSQIHRTRIIPLTDSIFRPRRPSNSNLNRPKPTPPARRKHVRNALRLRGASGVWLVLFGFWSPGRAG